MVNVRTRLVVAVAGVGLVAGSLLVAGEGPSHAIPGALTFPGSGFGPIPDGGTPCPLQGAGRVVTFNVTGVPTGAPSDVRITGLALTHTHVGDLTASLYAPDGLQTIVLFARTGATTAMGAGDSSDLAGPYSFADDAGSNWWSAAAAASPGTTLPAGAYRPSAPGGAGSTGAQTDLTSAFSAVSNANGVWILKFNDGCASDTGSVTAATLEIVPKCVPRQTAVTAAQAKVTTANAAVPSAEAAVAAADQAVQDASAAVASAIGALAKAEKALKKAKASGKQGRIKKAKKKLKAARAALKATLAALTATQQSAATAQQKLTGALAGVTAAQAELAAAQAALAACQSP